MRRFSSLLWFFFLAPTAIADEAVLKGGTRLEGVVLSQDEKGVLLLLPGSTEIRIAAKDVAELVPDPVAPTGRSVIRYEDRGERGGSLQVALIHLVKEGAPRIDLLGAVHIADESYWREVQALLERAEVVLYEMVKPRGLSPEEASERSNPIRDLQQKFARGFGLEFQFEGLRYDRPHFVHADVTAEDLGGGAGPGLPEQIRALEPFVKAMGSGVEVVLGGEGPEAERRRLSVKRTFARLLGMLGSQAQVLVGPVLSEILIERRNGVVIERLKSLPAGTHDVTVLYGAGHLPDLEARIVRDLGYRRAGARWLDAWRVPAEVPAKEPEPAGGTR